VLKEAFSIALLTLPGVPTAQETRCDARTFHEMHQCAVARHRQAEADHERAYREAAARLEPSSREKLRKAQEAWARYRAAHCDFESSKSAGRREYAVVRLRCMAELTEARTAVLSLRVPLP